MSWPLKKITLFFVVLILLAGCDLYNVDTTTTSNRYLSIETDKEVYQLDETDFIEATITNTSIRTIHYNGCLPITMEVLGDSGEIIDTIGFPVCECLCLATLEPGEKLNPDITNVPINFPLIREKLDEHLNRTFRIRFEFSLDSNWEQMLPHSLSRTPPFVITDS